MHIQTRKVLFLLLFAMPLFIGYSCKSKNDVIPPSAHIESWEQLFNGKNLNGWTANFKDQKVGLNYKNTFRVDSPISSVTSFMKISTATTK